MSEYLIDMGSDFRVNLFRKSAAADENGVIAPKANETKNETNETIALRLIYENPAITQKELKERMQVSLVTVKRLMTDLQKDGRIQRKGSSRKGTWQIVEARKQ